MEFRVQKSKKRVLGVEEQERRMERKKDGK